MKHACALALALVLAGPVKSQPPQLAAFDALLRANVNAGQVNYPGFQQSTGLKAYVEALAAPSGLTDRAERLAYAINAYNAFAIQGILEGLSPSSFLGRQRYFRLKEWPLDGGRITLHDLEHRVLRPLGEPRIHFAIICASTSCPLLRSEAFVGARLDAQLDEHARQFVNDPSRNRFEPTSGVAHLSEIFKWFDEDFRDADSVQKYVARYATDPEVAKRLAVDGFRIEWIPYDWTLNGTPPR